MEQISESYKPTLVKTLLIKVNKLNELSIVDALGDSHDVYNFNCYYDYKNPKDFLDALLKTTFQHIEYSIIHKIENTWSLTIRGMVCCDIIVNKKIIYFKSESVSNDEHELKYSNVINTFTLLKKCYFFLNRHTIFKHLNSITIQKFKLDYVHLIIRKISYYQQKLGIRDESDKFNLSFQDIEMHQYFSVEYNCDTHDFKFIGYLEHEGEQYSNGTEIIDEVGLKQHIDDSLALYNMYPIQREFWSQYKLSIAD